MLRPDALLQNLRRLGRKLRRKAGSAARRMGWDRLADPAVMLQPTPIPVPVRTRRKG